MPNQSMTEEPETEESDTDPETAVTAPHQKLGHSIESNVPRIRYIFLLVIVSTFIASFVLVIVGTLETLRIVFELINPNQGVSLNQLKVEFLEVIDQFLLATIFYVISVGFYQLFWNRRSPFDPWLKVDSVHDLEEKLIGVLITLLGVTGLGRIVTWDGTSDLLPFGVTVGLLIAALAFYAVRSKD
jgi:uncharacterized membrane protein YqhA